MSGPLTGPTGDKSPLRIPFHKEDLTAILLEFPNDLPGDVMLKLIKFLRFLDQDNDGVEKGREELEELLNKNIIGMDVYYKLKLALEQFQRPCEIIITGDGRTWETVSVGGRTHG